MNAKRAQEIFQLLKSHYPHAKMVLQWGNNFELLVAIILSAQCTDKKVNEVTTILFPKYRKRRQEFEKFYKQYISFILSEAKDLDKDSGQARMTDELEKEYAKNKRTSLSKGHKNNRDPHVANAPQDDNLDFNSLVEIVNFANVPLAELEQDIKSTGFYHTKAKSVQNAAKIILEKFNGILPRSIQELTTIPGVGRKTANVFLTNAYHIDEGIAVDTHVKKQAKLLGLSNNIDPIKIEQDLMKLFPKNQWHDITYLLIEHGRNVRKKKSDRTLCNKKDCALCQPYR